MPSHTVRARAARGLPGLAFLLPAFILFIIFVVYPIVYNIQASTLEWDGVNPALRGSW